LHNVGTNLAAKGNVEFAFIKLVGVGLALLDCNTVEPRPEQLHRHLAILALATLRLATDDDVSGNVSDANSGFHLVDILAAFAAGAKGVHAQIFGPDVNFDAVVNFWNHKDGGKGGVATRGL